MIEVVLSMDFPNSCHQYKTPDSPATLECDSNDGNKIELDLILDIE